MCALSGVTAADGDQLVILQANGEKYAQAHVRRFVDELGQVAQAVLLLAEAQWELDNSLPTIKPDVATHYINRHLRPDYDAMDDEDYLSRLERLMGAV